MHAVLDLIKKLYRPRTCRQPFSQEGVENGKYQVCLEYHIKNCGGPCVRKQSLENYQNNIEQARKILTGNTRQLLREIKEEMLKFAEELRFEEAEELKRRYLLIDQFVSKS
jgi:excinuclease ABC subunit C